MIVLEIESFPLEEAAVRAFARARIRAVEGNIVRISKSGRERIEVTWMGGPADQVRLNEFRQTVVVWRIGLQRIERDDFKIVFLAKREKSILRAASGMDAA